MKTIKPKKLQKNDTIGIISPGSSPDDLSKIEDGVKYLENLGYNVEIGKNVGKTNGYLAGNDNERLNDLHYMFQKREIKAIFCLRGGYGSCRLLDKIDFNIIKKNPKIFVGYSDITALHLAIFKKTNLITFAGPMIASDFLEGLNEKAEEFFWSMMTSSKKIGRIKSIGDREIQSLRKGKSHGTLLGGNLSVLTSLLGSDFIPKFDKNILLLEETCEPPYKIDRMFNQLRLAGIFQKTAGVILGSFNNCHEENSEKYTYTLGEVIQAYLGNSKKPVIYNLSHGHIKEILTLPIGLKVKLNADRNYIEFTESGVA